MRKISAILMIQFFILNPVQGQELKMGFVTGGNIFQETILSRTTLSPDNSYFTYLENNPGDGLVNKKSVFNGFHIGGAFSFAYKRFSFNFEPQFYYQRSTFKFRKTYYTERLLGKKAFRAPLYFTYKFFKKENSLFAIAGLSYNKETNTDIQNPGLDYYIGGYDIYSYKNDGGGQYLNINYGDDHFNEILYDDRPYWNVIFGLGRTFDRVNVSFRIQKELDLTNHRVEAKIWQFELSFSFLFLSTKDFTQKHFLYVD